MSYQLLVERVEALEQRLSRTEAEFSELRRAHDTPEAKNVSKHAPAAPQAASEPQDAAAAPPDAASPSQAGPPAPPETKSSAKTARGGSSAS